MSAPAPPVRVGVIGCGMVSEFYLRNAPRFASFDVVAVADVDHARAADRAATFGVQAVPVDRLLADDSIELIANLTPPAAHAAVSIAAIDAGKAVYSEKPFGVDRLEARAVLDAAQRSGARVGSAPDTFLGPGLQTSRRLVDEGAIGEPRGATALFARRGPEAFHPAPQPYYGHGAGPLFDMGVYYVSAVVALLGPVRRVTAMAWSPVPVRTIAVGPDAGATFRAEQPTWVSGVLELASGVLVSLVTTFDAAHDGAPIEILGSAGALRVPDPNQFAGPVAVRGAPGEWRDVALGEQTPSESRGLGIADLASAMREGRPHRANVELAYHVIDVLASLLDSTREGRIVEVASTCERPEPL